ncbi:MAG: transglycosylase SLT domain-containing protein [Nitrospirae bacterium]|nr:transglycosylase SLT domain-containing protein [Nitrospirota bacterium]
MKIKTISLLSFVMLFVLAGLCTASGPASDVTGATENRLKKAVELISKRSYKDAEHILLDIEGDGLPEKQKAYFLLGRLYREEGSFEKAENYLIKAAGAYPLLKDYALKVLTEIYMTAGKYEKAIGTARQIKNSLLLQYSRQSEIKALLSLKREKEAVEALSQYVQNYPSEWDYKLTLAALLKNDGKIDLAVLLLKEVYINAVPLSNGALTELKILKADIFTKDEILKRADNLFEKNNFQRAEIEYQKALTLVNEYEKDKVGLAIAMCRFRLKQYDKAAKSFSLINTPEALYWQAYSFYRIDKRDGFIKIKKEFESNYPNDERLALLLFMEAEDFRIQDNFNDAEKSFKEVLNSFPARAEDALWGLGWMNYVSGNYKNSSYYFSQLATYEKSENYYKYLYWNARSNEKATEKCRQQKVSLQFNDKGVCDGEGNNFFSGLPSDRSFYGYLIKMRSSSHVLTDRIEVSKPVKPEGEVYERIEVLALLGMRDEAVNEIIDLLKRNKNKNDFLYLGYKAMQLGEYRKIIAFAEKETDREFLPYSFPFGFGDIIEEAVDSRGVDKYLVAAVIREESRFDPDAVSWAGAMGLMQLMPATAYRVKKDIKLRLKDSSEIHDVKKNIFLGTHYLSGLIKEFKELPFAIAAYNAGENALKRWMAKYNKNDIIEFIENIPYKETRLYVKKVLRSYWRYRTMNGLPVETSQVVAQGRP